MLIYVPMPDLDSLQERLGYHFTDRSLLELALVHSSYINENPGLTLVSNERLEFLGDAVLGLVIAERLYRELPQSTEGDLTRLRASLVRRDVLARVANEIALGGNLNLGKGEEASGGRSKPANLAGALEAVIAAIFLDSGLASARDLVIKLFGDELSKSASHGIEDFKSQLQELLQARQQPAPTYHVTRTTGPDHDRTFTVEVKAAGKVLGVGSGKSKKAAETEAARSALKSLSTDFTE